MQVPADGARLDVTHVNGADGTASEARRQKARRHTMRLSADHSRLAAFHFNDPTAADEFLDVIKSLTANPDDPLLNVSHRCKKNKNKNKSNRSKSRSFIRFLARQVSAASKASISAPCCFTHVTRMSHEDAVRLMSAFDERVSVGGPSVT